MSKYKPWLLMAGITIGVLYLCNSVSTLAGYTGQAGGTLQA